VALLLALALILEPQDLPPGVDGELQARINLAIDQGVDALLRAQELDGSWRSSVEDFGTGMTALAAYTLIKCGLAKDHPAIERAFHFLRSRETTRTYSMSCLILAIIGRGDPEDRIWLEECAATLSDWETGGYAYPDGALDLSNTAYAALALYAAGEAGVKVPYKTWEGIAEYALACRERGGEKRGPTTGGETPFGFAYQPLERNPTGSMTASAVAVLTMAERRLRPMPSEMLRARGQGLAWLEANFSVEHNPMRDLAASKWIDEDHHLHYYLYALERACALTGVERLGERLWYAEGARHLVDHQEHTGNWQSNQPNTCFALLFLTRATSGGRSAVTPAVAAGAPSALPQSFAGDVDLRVNQRPPTHVWIADYSAWVTKHYAWDESEGGGLRVLEVRFFEQPPFGERRPLGQVMSTSHPSQEPMRAALPIKPDRAGIWLYSAEVDLLFPGADPAEEGSRVTVHSSDVKAEFLHVADPVRLAYAQDSARNLLPTDRCTATASSQPEDAYFSATRAADGLQGTGWRSLDDDPLPWIRLELQRATKADRLLLSQHYDFRNQDPNHTGRITRIELLLNGEKRGVEVDVNPDPERKTEIPLGSKTIRSIEIRVLERTPGREGANGVGFNEIELQRGR
jgi:hypothetical protein